MRQPITTVYTPRVKPTTNYMRPREWFCYTWDNVPWTWDEANFSWDESCFDQIKTIMTSTRYAKYVQDLTWSNVFDLSWSLVQWISGSRNNKIVTPYT